MSEKPDKGPSAAIEGRSKSPEQALCEREHLLRVLADHSPGHIAYVGADDLCYYFVNQKFESSFGRPREEIIGRHIKTIIGRSNYEFALKYIERVRAGESTAYENVFDLQQGRRWIQVNYEPDFDDQGNVKGIIVLSYDITELKQAEENLRNSERLYRSLFENTCTATFVAEDDFTISQVNTKCEALAGYSREELVGRMKTTDFVAPEDLDRLINYHHARRTLAEAVPSEYEVNIINRQGEIKTVLVQTGLIPETHQTIASMIDITPRKKAEKALQQAQRMESIGTLAGGIAHDFNNLLMGIQGNVSLMMADIDRRHPHYERLDNIAQCVKSGSELTGQLLGIARGGQYELKTSDLNPIIDTSVDIFGRTKKEIRIHKKYQKEIWAVDIDRGQIEQVLLNLYVNAWQAMPTGGDLLIQTENVILDEDYADLYQAEPGKFVKISVTDTGIGMDAGTQQRIFDPFFTTKDKDRGTGLGLASAYGIINNHGGIITVDSKPGKGTTVTIYLPASEKEIVHQPAKPEQLRQGSELVLLVDDEQLILEVGRDMLERLGYSVVVAESGRQALEIYGRDPDAIAMVILDMIMPDMSGGETYDRLKTINPAVKTLLSSGYSINGKAQAILNSGCQGFIQKPFNLTDLSQKIRKILDDE